MYLINSKTVCVVENCIGIRIVLVLQDPTQISWEWAVQTVLQLGAVVQKNKLRDLLFTRRVNK